MSATLTSSEEQAMLGAVKRATSLADSGDSPNDAIEKIAREHGFGPGKIRLIATAYNTGSQLNQFRERGSILDKLASFELADADLIIDAIYGEKTKKASTEVHSDFSRPPRWVEDRRREKLAAMVIPSILPPIEKTAETEPEAEVTLHDLNRVLCRLKTAEEKVDELFQRASEARDATRTNVAALVEYFRTPGVKLALDQTEAVAATYFDKQAVQALFTVVHAHAYSKEKRASDATPMYSGPIPRTSPVMSLVERAIGSATACAQLTSAGMSAREKFATIKKGAMSPFFASGEVIDAVTEKSASVITSPLSGAVVGTMLNRGIGNIPQSVDGAWNELEDPDHTNELRKIRAHALLNSIMTDPEDPISGHDPDKVLAAYNDISQIAPRVAEYGATLRPELRKRLEGHTEPFEAQTTLGTEKSLTPAAPAAPTNSGIIPNGKSIFG